MVYNALVEYMEHYNNVFDIKIDQGDINNAVKSKKRLKELSLDWARSRYDFLNSEDILKYHDSIARHLLLHYG